MGLVMTVVAAAPRLADACTSDSLDRGLTIVRAAEPRTIASDGVLAFDAFILGEAPEVALARFALTLTPEGGGPAIAGEASHRVLGVAPFDELADYQEIVLVWRPETPLEPGTYLAETTVTDEHGGHDRYEFTVVVDAAAAPPISAPRVEIGRVATLDDEVLERVCCETGLSSCGTHSVCQPARVRVVPGFIVNATLAPADVERALLWVAPWDGQAPGLPYERMNPWYRYPEFGPWWSEWRDEIRLPDAVGERCIVIGATSLIDGSTAFGAPICGELTAASEEPRTPMFPPPHDTYQCLTPPVYEHDGSPYPPEPERGCRLAATGPGPLLLVLLALRRRRAR
jgi:hypothetical protein